MDNAPPGHRVRTVDHWTPPEDAPSAPEHVWREYGQALLAFHHRVGMTAMCRCGETVIACTVLAMARQRGLLPKDPAKLEGSRTLPAAPPGAGG